MSTPLLIFEPLDLPPDIRIVLNDDFKYYVFNKNICDELIYFTVEKKENAFMESIILEKYEKTENKLFEHIQYDGYNVNEYLWKISDYNYERRFLKLEIIERLRCCNNENDLKNILEYIRQIPIETPSDGEDS